MFSQLYIYSTFYVLFLRKDHLHKIDAQESLILWWSMNLQTVYEPVHSEK